MSFLSILALEEISKPFILHTDITRVIYAYKAANRHRDVRTTCRSPIQTQSKSVSSSFPSCTLAPSWSLGSPDYTSPTRLVPRLDIAVAMAHIYKSLNLQELQQIAQDRFSLNANSIAPSSSDSSPSQSGHYDNV